MGRKSLYKPEYCQGLVEAGRNGKSVAWYGASIGHPRQTLVGWAMVHPEFKEAMDLHKAMELRWWEDFGQEGAGGLVRGFNAVSWIFTMKARFRREGYADLDMHDDRPQKAKAMTEDDIVRLIEKARGLPGGKDEKK